MPDQVAAVAVKAREFVGAAKEAAAERMKAGQDAGRRNRKASETKNPSRETIPQTNKTTATPGKWSTDIARTFTGTNERYVREMDKLLADDPEGAFQLVAYPVDGGGLKCRDGFGSGRAKIPCGFAPCGRHA